MRAFLALLALLLAGAAHAQAPSPAQMGITPTTPQSLQALDSTKTWVPFGTIDQTSHTFSGMSREIALASFGAKCDGTTDDTAAIQNWLAKAANGTKLVGSPGTCVFKSALVVPPVSDLILDFLGGTLRYQGASTTINLLSVGQQTSPCTVQRVAIRDLTMVSDTAMTAGDAFLSTKICLLTMNRVYFGNVSSPNNNFYNGCHFSGGNQMYISNYSCRGTHIGEIDNGDSVANGGTQSTDFYHANGALSNSPGIGLNVAGNCGGCEWYSTDIVGNDTYNVLIDQSQTPGKPNAQILFGPGLASDGTIGDGVRISDPGTTNTCPGPGRCGNVLLCQNCWISTASRDCLVIDPAVKWEIQLIGVRMQNCQRHGVNNASSNIHLIIDGGVIAQASNTGIFNTATLPWIQFLAPPSMFGNTVQDTAGLTPTIVSGCGGAGAGFSDNSNDYEFSVVWGSTAGQTTCVINFGTYHFKRPTHINASMRSSVTFIGVAANTISATTESFFFSAGMPASSGFSVTNSGLGF